MAGRILANQTYVTRSSVVTFQNILTLKFQFQISKVWKSYIDLDNDGLEIGMNGDEDEDIVIDTEHASRQVDTEGGGEAVADVDEGN